MSMTEEQVDTWITALESDDYEQAQGNLRDTLYTHDDFWDNKPADEASGEHSYCCLGLYCELQGFDLSKRPWGTNAEGTWAAASGTTEAPPVLRQAMGTEMRDLLADLNDTGANFREIAQVVRYLRDRLVLGRAPLKAQKAVVEDARQRGLLMTLGQGEEVLTHG